MTRTVLKIGLVSVLVAVLQLGHDASAQQQKIIRAGLPDPISTPLGQAFLEFKRVVEAQTGKSIDVQLFPSSQLGPIVEQITNVKQGSQEMMVSTPGMFSRFYPRTDVLEMPFLLTDWDKTERLFASEVFKRLVADADKQTNIRILGAFPAGFRNIMNRRGPITSLADLKGLKIRLQESPVHLATFRTIGASPITLPIADVYPAVQSGVVDGLENSNSILFASKFYEVAKNLTETRHFFNVFLCYINSDDLDFLAAVAGQSTLALENARLFTNLRRTLDQTLEMKNLMDDIFASMATGVITTDMKRRITLFNRAAEKILGIPIHQVLGKPLSQAVPGLGVEMEKIVESALQGSTKVSELNQGNLVLQLSLSPLRDARLGTKGATIVFEDLTERRKLEAEQERIRQTFGRVVAPRVRDRLLADPGNLRLDGDKGIVTALFADLHGFTSYSEKHDPEVVFKVLNSYLSLAAQAILDEEGTLDKFMGDAVLAIWNSPLALAYNQRMSFHQEIIQLILTKNIQSKDELHKFKVKLCRKYKLRTIPRDSEILAKLPADQLENGAVHSLLRKKSTRTLSGVSIIAAMTSPETCPHGRCIPCPGGPERNTPQSYTGYEPAAMRACCNNIDPYLQITSRIEQLHAIGHVTDKVDLIIMGGTFTARLPEYQQWFVKRCYDALNNTESKTLEQAKKNNETALFRCIGLTVETRPDWFPAWRRRCVTG